MVPQRQDFRGVIDPLLSLRENIGRKRGRGGGECKDKLKVLRQGGRAKAKKLHKTGVDGLLIKIAESGGLRVDTGPSNLAFSTTKRMGEVKYPSSLTYPAKELCISSVAERALYLWNNDHIVSLMSQNRSIILPVIFEALEKNMQSHWNQAIHGLTASVRKMFQDMDGDLFEDCRQQYIDRVASAKTLEEQRELAWRRLEAVVAAKAAEETIILVN
ncbi:hypothetical protein BHM03_00050821 [Ensete ventricosum]|nr:hypothetical protein BHM03_00050821 [Ensete ventricosum]